MSLHRADVCARPGCAASPLCCSPVQQQTDQRTCCLQALFLAADGPSIGMQLFNQQAASLHTAMQGKSLHWAQLGSFFALLGALPQCLKAEADAILPMIRRAREEKQEDEDEAKQNCGKLISFYTVRERLIEHL